MDNLEKFNLNSDPITTFNNWFKAAETAEQNAPACTLSTASIDGIPSARIMLFKGIQDNQFTFFTNYNSNKAANLEENPYACLTFYWHVTGKQVRVFGKVKKTDAKTSKDYFLSRGRDSQIASAISNQSSPIENREELVKLFEAKKDEIGEGEVSYPENWGGFFIDPMEIEFFIYGEHRLNDRFLYKKNEESWSVERLQP